MLVSNVHLVFQPGGATLVDAVPAPNQHVYIDLTPGVMTHLRTDATGKLYGVPPAPTAVKLDDQREYKVVVLPDTKTPMPTPATGKVLSGRLSVEPHIAVKVTGSGSRGSTAVSGLECRLWIAGTESAVTTSPGGWVISNIRTDGAVRLRSNTRILKSPTAQNPAVTLTTTPSAPNRGENVTINITAPAASVGFKVLRWTYAISHTNPNATTAATATVTRPTSEDPKRMDRAWEGPLCASGTASARFVFGVELRASGVGAVASEVAATDPIEATLAITVAARAGASRTSGLVENAETEFAGPINAFEDTGRHGWTATPPYIGPPMTIPVGPNKGCKFLTAATVTFTSSPKINSNLSNPNSAFSLAQDKAYLTSPAPVRVIPRHLYDVGATGAITEKTSGAIGAHFGITGTYGLSKHCIDRARLLAGTQRHEHTGQRSHKSNCLKARRALEPLAFVEALVSLPGETVNFMNLFQARVDRIVLGAGPTHNIVDEERTRSAGDLVFVPGTYIPAVNATDTGSLIGPVWNPATNSQLTK